MDTIRHDCTLLLVEDDKITARIQKKALEDFSYNVIIAYSGEEAIDTVKNKKGIDLVLTDIEFGDGIDGIETADYILSSHNIPVVFLSSHTGREIVKKTEKINAYGYMTKGSNITSIDASIKIALRFFQKEQAYIQENEKRRKALKQLVIDKERLNLLFEAFPGFIYLQANDYSIRYANKYFLEKFGDPSGKHCYDVIWGRSLPCELCPTFKVFEDNAPRIWEWSDPFDGRKYTIYDHPFIDIDGSPLVLEFGIDNTELYKMKNELKQIEEKYQSLFMNITEMIVLHEVLFNENNEAVNYRIIECNNAFTQITGIKRENAIGRLSTDVYGTPDPPFIDQYAKVATTGEPCRFTAYFKPMDKYFDIRAISIGKDQFATLSFDISKIKKAEQELTKAKETAENATRQKSRFLAHITHDIKTPLNVIVNYLHAFSETRLDLVQKDYADTVLQASEMLQYLVNDLLDLSKIESCRLNLKNTGFEVGEVMDSLYKLLKIKAEAKGIELSFTIDEHIPAFLKGDPDRLKQILVNILNNSIKFTEKGSVKLFVSKREENDDQIMLYFRVKDTGIGIPKTELSRLFDPFYQAAGNFSCEGTGLGLTIAKNLTEVMGGAIKIDSEEGAGTEVSFEIRLQKFDQRPEMKTEDNPSSEDHNYELVRVMIAENDYLNQKVMQMIFNKLKIKPDIVSNGKQAVESFHKKDYEIIFMDLEMEIMDGFEATKVIRSLSHSKKYTPVIAMTAYNPDDIKDKAKECGFNDILSKPVDIDKIAGIIHKHKGELSDIAETFFTKDKFHDQPVFDKYGLLKKIDGNVEIYKTMLEYLLTAIPEKTALMKEACESGDLIHLKMLNHGLKGTMLHMNALSFLEIIKKIEEGIKNNSCKSINMLINDLMAEEKILLDFIKNELNDIA